MTDTTKQNEQASTEQSYDYAGQPQSFFNDAFASQIGQSLPQGLDTTREVLQAYFDSVESTTRTARRISEVWANQMLLQQSHQMIAQAVVPQVIAALRSNPQWLKPVMDQAGKEQKSSSR